MQEYYFIDFLMPLILIELFKLPMVRQASRVHFVTISFASYYSRQTISIGELLDFLKAGPESKDLMISEHFLEDGHAELLHKLLKVSQVV